jgi:hypothetical protein
MTGVVLNALKAAIEVLIAMDHLAAEAGDNARQAGLLVLTSLGWRARLPATLG